jgi:hypothetical protein
MNIDQDIRGIADDIAPRINEIFGEKYGFMLLVFPFGGGPAHYISNSSRKDMIKALREKADVLEAKMDLPVNSIDDSVQ